jgi:hypothetical protein
VTRACNLSHDHIELHFGILDLHIRGGNNGCREDDVTAGQSSWQA